MRRPSFACSLRPPGCVTTTPEVFTPARPGSVNPLTKPLVFCLSLLLLVIAPTHGTAADQTSENVEGLHSNPPSVWAITGAKVVVSPEITLPEATIVVRHGKIDQVGAEVKVPVDARTIDGAGKTIYAGFIDAYSEQSVSSDALMKTARYWNNNVTPQLSVAGQVEEPGSTGYALRKQGIVARLIAPADGVIRGRSVLAALTDGPINTQLIAVDVAQHLELTVSRRGRSGYPGSPMGAVALARQAMYDAQWYRDAWNAARADSSLPRPETNDALAALGPVISGALPVIIETSDELFLQRADLFAAEFGLNLIVRGSGREYRRMAEVIAAKRPIILPLEFPSAPNVSTAEAAQDVSLESLLHWDLAPENPARVDEAGITFAFSAGDDFLKSLRTAVKRGLSPASALRALTVTPARMFDVADQLGTVEKGKLASFVITDGDLFDSKTKIVETWVSGSRFEYISRPTQDVSGQYQIALGRSDHMPEKLFVQLKQDGSKVSGRISQTEVAKSERASAEKTESGDKQEDTGTKEDAKKSEDDKKAKPLTLAGVSLSDGVLTASFNTKDWDIEGITRITLVMTNTDGTAASQPAALGTIVWPSGKSATAIAQRLNNEEGSDEASKEPSASDSEKKDAAGESKSKEGSDVEQAALVADKETTNEEKGKDDRDDKASFAVNYPLGAYGRRELPDQPELAAFVHATLWTCGPDGVIEDGTLLVQDGRIVAAGHEIEIPKAAKIYDVRGMHISPGLIDCHSHAATDGGVNESTQSITCEVRIGDFIDSDDITIYRQLAGGVTAANILHGSANPIGGQNQVIKLRWGMNGEQMKFAEAPKGVKFALGENVKQSNWSTPTGRYPQTRMGVEQLYRDAFQATRDYAARMDAWEKERRGLPPRRNLELDALREIIEGKRWIHCHSYRQDEILALIRILDEYKITIGTFQHILEGYKVADAMARHGAMASAFSDWWAYKMEVQDAIPYAGALMHSAGVVVSFNSDDGELARHLNQEAAKAIKYGGVSREEALKFVTLNPARQLRIDQYVGSLEAGKHADFVIWNGDPLSNFSRCEQTWIDGRPFFHRREDEQLRKDADEMRNTLIQKILKSGAKMRPEGQRDNDPAALWPRIDEFCRHLEFSQQVRMLDEQAIE